MSDKRAIVTGAAAGIGAAAALRLSRVGYEVHAVDRDPRVAHTPPEGCAAGHVCDVSDPEQIAQVCDVVLAEGPVRLLVNSAGVSIGANAVDGTLEDWNRSFDVNARAPWLFSQRVIPGMVDAGGGSILNVASAAGLRPSASRIYYASSKAALIQLTRSIAVDYAEFNVRANAICPGAVDTGLWRSLKPSDTSLESFAARAAQAYPMKRLGTLDEVAGTIEFLASDAAAYITGVALSVDGGRTLH